MNIYKASELLSFLNSLGIDPKKRLSQNFLIDGNILRKIIKAAHIQPGDRILEIGPGPGALTEQLLKAGAAVTAFEIDPLFAQALHRFGENLTVIEGDFLNFPLETFLKENPSQQVKVVANLPYHIATPILTRLLPLSQGISSLTIMVQKEFAKRVVATAGTPDYSSLSIFTAFYSTPHYCFTVEPTCFYPRPKVQSAVVHCALHPPPLTSSTEPFFRLVRTAFQKRRKMLRSALKELYGSGRVEEALEKIGLNKQSRPEELSLDQFLHLFEDLR